MIAPCATQVSNFPRNAAIMSRSTSDDHESSFLQLPTELHLLIVKSMEYPSMISFMLVVSRLPNSCCPKFRTPEPSYGYRQLLCKTILMPKCNQNHHFYNLVDHIRRKHVTLIENYAIREFLWRKQCRGCGEWKKRSAFPTFQPYSMTVDLWEQGIGPWIGSRVLLTMKKFCYGCLKVDDIMCHGSFSAQMLAVHWQAIKIMILGK